MARTGPKPIRHKIEQPLDCRLIPLTQGQNAKVSIEDYERLAQFPWYAAWNKDTKSFYAERDSFLGNYRRVHLKMHRCILGCAVDHINHDTLDNRRENLRPASPSQNTYNRRKYRTNTSGFIGVKWRKDRNKWRASISYEGKEVHLGYFDLAEEAAKIRDEAANKFHGAFATLNF